MAVSADRFTNEFQAAPSPDGNTVAFAARGVGDSQWWRNGHSHLDESEIWVRHDGAAATYERLIDLNGRNAWPMWMPDGRQLYFMSDRGGAQNIWTLTSGRQAEAGDKVHRRAACCGPRSATTVRPSSSSATSKSGSSIPRAARHTRCPITLVGSAASPEIQHLSLTQFSDLTLSPDARKIALIGHGEIFVSSAREGGQALRVTRTPAAESQVTWAPDSMRVAYLSPRDAVNHVFLYDFAHHAETQLTRDALPDQGPHFSPDGKSIAFIRDRKELRVVDPESKQERLLTSGFLGGGFGPGALTWSPDGKWIAYAGSEPGGLRNVYVIPAAGGTPRPVTFLSNGNVNSLEWSPDGKFLLFESGQRTETPQVVRIDLVPRQPKFAEERVRRFVQAGTASPGRTRCCCRDPGQAAGESGDRVRRHSRTGLACCPSASPFPIREISPDGKLLLFAATVGTQTNLYTLSSGRDTRRRRRPRVGAAAASAVRAS